MHIANSSSNSYNFWKIYQKAITNIQPPFVILPEQSAIIEAVKSKQKKKQKTRRLRKKKFGLKGAL